MPVCSLVRGGTDPLRCLASGEMVLWPDAAWQGIKPFISLLPNVKPEMATHENVAERHVVQAFTSSPLALETPALLCPVSSTFPGLKDV